MQLKVFVKEDCPNCPAAKEVANQFPFSRLFDMDEAEGLAEAAFHSVLCTPSMVLVDDQEMVITVLALPRPEAHRDRELRRLRGAGATGFYRRVQEAGPGGGGSQVRARGRRRVRPGEHD